MRLRNVYSIGLLLIAPILMAWQSQAVTEAPKFDYEKINSSIHSALTKFSAKSTTIDRLMYSFDPSGTNVHKDQYLLDVELDLPKSPWNGNPSHTLGKLGFTDLVGKTKSGLQINVDLKVETDALSMLKYKFKKISHCETDKSAKGLVAVVWRRHCNYVDQLQSLNSITEVHDMLVKKIADHKSDLSFYKKNLQRAMWTLETSTIHIQEPANGDVKEILQAELDLSEKVISFLNGIVLKRSGAGFAIIGPNLDVCPFLGINGVKLVAHESSLAFKGSVNLKAGKGLYRVSKPILIDILQGLENGDAYAEKLIQLDAEVIANMIENLLEEKPVSQK